MAKGVTLAIELARQTQQRIHLPSRAEKPHNSYPVGSDNCSEPVALDSPTLPLEYGSFYHPIAGPPCMRTGRKITWFLFYRLVNLKELQ